MGGDVRYPREQALAAANRLIAELKPWVKRIEVLGSIRRQKPEVGDIEILYEPHFSSEPSGLFQECVDVVNVTMGRLAYMRLVGLIEDRLDANGRAAFGQRYQRVRWEGIPCDLFACIPPASWGVLQLIRTGSGDFNKRIMSSKAAGGLMPYGMRCENGQLFDRGKPLDIPFEEHFFEAIGIPYIAPEDRR